MSSKEIRSHLEGVFVAGAIGLRLRLRTEAARRTWQDAVDGFSMRDVVDEYSRPKYWTETPGREP